MQVLGLTIARTATLQKSLGALANVPGSRGWWPLIRDITTGAWQRNEEVSVETVLSNTTLYAIVTLIAGDIAKLRPKLMEKDKNGVWTEIESSAFSPAMRKPNAYQSRIDFIEWWMMSKLCHGNTYVLKARDGRGVPVQGHILDPYRVQPLVAPDGSVFYQLNADDLARVKDAIVVPAREIIHDVMCPLFHPLVGVSPIYAAGYAAMQGLNIRSSSNKFFTNGSKPGGVLTAPGPIGQDTADRIKAFWDSEFSGENIGKIAVLGDGLKYEAMAVSADDAKLVEQLRMTDEAICGAYHMPRHKVCIGPDPTYNNIQGLNIQYYSDCLQKHIEKLEDKWDYGFELVNVPGKTLGMELDRDALFEMDTAVKADAAVKALGSGMTPNETRFQFHGLGPIAGGDTVYLQRQNWPITMLGSDAEPSDLTPDDPEPEDDQIDDQDLEKLFHAEIRKVLAA